MGKRPRCDTVAGRVRNAIVAFVAAAALWVARPATAADAPPLLTLPPGANATLVLSDKPDQPNGGGAAFTARVPVTVAADKDIDVRLTDVAYKDARSADWFQRFAVDLDRTTAPAAYALIVSHRDAKLWPGTYALTLRVSEKPKKATDKPAAPIEVVLNVQVPVPQLSASTKLVLGFTIDSAWALSGAPDKSGAEAARIQFAERGGKVGAFDLEAVEFHDLTADAATGTGTLVFDPPRVSVPANTAAAVAVSASGVFPLGVTKGKIEWMSPSLATPQAVPFEVKVTRARWWIAIVAFVGVVSGFILRTLLTDFRGKLAARESVTLSLLQASRALEGRADTAYRSKLESIVQTLADALAGDDSKTMLEAATKTAAEIKALSDALEARFPPARDKLSEINALVSRQLHLPEPVAALAERLRGQGSRGNQLLQQRDMTGAEALLLRLSQQEVPDLVRAAAGLVANLARFLRDTAAAPFPMGAAATRLLQELANDAASAKLALDASTAPSPTDARSLLLRADALWLQCLGLADDAEALSRELCDNAAALLRPLPAAEAQAFEAVANASIAAARRFATDMRALGGGPVFGGFPPVQAQWLGFLTKVAPTLPLGTVQPLLDKAEWLDALRAAVDARIAADRQAGHAVRSTLDVPAPRDDATAAALNRQPVPPVTAGGRIDTTQPALRPDDLAHRRQALVKRRWQAQLLQSLGLVAVFVLVSYFVYGDAWIGTYKEMATLFVLAFGLELTGDGVVAAFKKT